MPSEIIAFHHGAEKAITLFCTKDCKAYKVDDLSILERFDSNKVSYWFQPVQSSDLPYTSHFLNTYSSFGPNHKELAQHFDYVHEMMPYSADENIEIITWIYKNNKFPWKYVTLHLTKAQFFVCVAIRRYVLKLSNMILKK